MKKYLLALSAASLIWVSGSAQAEIIVDGTANPGAAVNCEGAYLGGAAGFPIGDRVTGGPNSTFGNLVAGKTAQGPGTMSAYIQLGIDVFRNNAFGNLGQGLKGTKLASCGIANP